MHDQSSDEHREGGAAGSTAIQGSTVAGEEASGKAAFPPAKAFTKCDGSSYLLLC